MSQLIEVTKELGTVPPGSLIWIAVLAGFGLAAFAIHAVVSVVKDRR